MTRIVTALTSSGAERSRVRMHGGSSVRQAEEP
jgi:hypothetical protein